MKRFLRRTGRLAALASLALLVACSAIRFGSEGSGGFEGSEGSEEATAPAPEVDGQWTGSIDVEADRIPADLTLVQENRRLEASLTSDDIGLTASGTGEIRADGAVELDLSYALECPGTATLTGRLESGRMTGRVRASDCTGTFEGDFAFRRR